MRGRDHRPHHLNPGFNRNATQIEIAANPAGPARRGRQRLSPDDAGRREGEAGEEQEVFHPPRRQIIVQ